jgi:hypothetical protein
MPCAGNRRKIRDQRPIDPALQVIIFLVGPVRGKSLCSPRISTRKIVDLAGVIVTENASVATLHTWLSHCYMANLAYSANWVTP